MPKHQLVTLKINEYLNFFQYSEMIELDKDKIKEARVALDAHKYTMPESYVVEQLDIISKLLTTIHFELEHYNYVIIKQEGADDVHVAGSR